MINKFLKDKKLLLVGSTGLALDMIPLAHRNGMKLGATDYYPDTYVKRHTDFRHNVSTTDVDALVQLAKEEGYDGIISSFSDMLSPYVVEAAEKMGFYSNYTAEQLRLSTDKKYFKETCLQYGVPVPKEYAVGDTQDIGDDIDYPVIVKPTDGMAARGITICNTKSELIEAIGFARSTSKCDSFIVEQFIHGDEINLTYIAVNGKISLAAIHDRYFTSSQESNVKMPDLYIYPSRYTDIVLEKYNDTIINMLESLGIRNGSLFMQACVKDGEVYIYEAGMRLNGCKTYQILEVENDFNTQEQLMRFAVSGDMGEGADFSPKFKRWYATMNVLVKVGGTVSAFKGLEEMASYPWLISVNRLYLEGDKIPESVFGTLGQRISTIHLYGETKEQLLERLDRVNQLYQVIDETGENIILPPHDIDEIRQKLDYDL